MQSKLENRMLLFNESMVSAYIYVLFVLTDFFAEINPERENCGIALVSTLLFTFLVNLIKFLVPVIRKLKKKLISKCSNKQKKDIAERTE